MIFAPPLVGITGAADMIKRETTEPNIESYAGHVVASGNALLLFLNEILESIRAASGTMSLLKKKFDLKEKLELLVELNRAKATEKQLGLLFEYDPTIPRYLIGDAVRVQRIVLELLTNALNFTHHGQVKIAVTLGERAERDLVLNISMQDTGIGIPLNKHDEIYMRFKRLNSSYDGVYQSGPGLGLGIVKQFIDDLDGEIYLESSPGEGAIFTCLIPLKEALLNNAFGVEKTTPALVDQKLLVLETAAPIHKQTVSKAQDASVVTGKSRILVVEDNALAAIVVKSLLVDLNCHVDIAANGLATVEQASAEPYDLIFMDIGLPDIDGCEVTRRIRLHKSNQNAEVPIIALTAHVDADDPHQCLEAGMRCVVNKPMSEETAKNILMTYLKAC